VARLLRRWSAAGLVTRRQKDGLPRYFASRDPALAPLVTLMQQDSTLVRTLRDALSHLKGVEVALVFGSVARGEEGATSDLDVLVLGSASELKLNAAFKPAGRALGRSVHATACTIESFKAQLRSGESFALDIVQGPRIPLIGDLDAALVQAVGR
jgi:predicted nucleotidyltransferase